MVQTYNQADTDISLNEQCKQFSEILGFDEPVPEEVLKAALQNESYAHNLLISRESPEMMQQLMNNPRSTGLGAKRFSNTELVSKAAAAFVRWGKTGFAVVSIAVLKQREDACLLCPNLKGPSGLLQNMVPAAAQNERPGHRTGKNICDLCGCNVANKIRLPSEVCPDTDPDNKGMTRWGEPVLGSSPAS